MLNCDGVTMRRIHKIKSGSVQSMCGRIFVSIKYPEGCYQWKDVNCTQCLKRKEE